MIFTLIKKTAKGTVNTVANIPAWFGLAYLRSNTIGMIKMIKPIYSSKEVNKQEKMTFEQAMQQYGVTEVELASGIRNLNWQVYLFGFLAVIFFGYMFYLFAEGHFLAGVLSITLSLFLIVKACFCRFWIFQIQKRKLGCTMQEWLQDKPKN